MRLVSAGNLPDQRWSHLPSRPVALLAKDADTAARLAREERLAIKRAQGWWSPMYVEKGTHIGFTQMFIRLHQARGRGFVLIVREWVLLSEEMRRMLLELARTQSFEGKPVTCLLHVYTSPEEMCEGRTDVEARLLTYEKLEAFAEVWRIVGELPRCSGAMVSTC